MVKKMVFGKSSMKTEVKLEHTFFHGEKDGISKKYDKGLLELETFDKGKRKSNNISLGLELNEVKLENGLYAKEY